MLNFCKKDEAPDEHHTRFLTCDIIDFFYFMQVVFLAKIP